VELRPCSPSVVPPPEGVDGSKVHQSIDPSSLVTVLTFILLKVNMSTLHENPAAVYVVTGALTHGAAHAGAPRNGMIPSAAIAPKVDALFCISLSLILLRCSLRGHWKCVL
jgi:hypothetical protein